MNRGPGRSGARALLVSAGRGGIDHEVGMGVGPFEAETRSRATQSGWKTVCVQSSLSL
jgi:hypothetical protein